MKKKIEDLLIATRNQGKFNELKKLLDPYVKNIISLESLNDFDEIEEDQKTYYGNSLKKAKHYYEKYLIPTLGDDSGIEIEGIKFWGSPWSNQFGNWAFMADDITLYEQAWSKIPEDTQVLITHGPAKGLGDEVYQTYGNE